MNKNSIKYKVKDYWARACYMTDRFAEEAKGVAAVEFALIAPLMFIMYVGSIETSNALSANRKLSRVSSTLGDLLTQETCFTNTTVNDIMSAADDIMLPYDVDVKIVVSGIQTTGNVTKVVWSRANANATAANVGDVKNIPSGIKINGNFLVMADISLDYVPAIGWLTQNHIAQLDKSTTALNMNEQLFLRPRVGSEVEIKSSC